MYELESPAAQTPVYETILQVQSEVEAFRDEFRESMGALEALIREGNAEVTSLLRQVEDVLVEQGLGRDEAEALTEGDPATFGERLNRWLTGQQARDAIEAAIWAALDFVPGGTGVKLGVKIAAAVRKAIKN